MVLKVTGAIVQDWVAETALFLVPLTKQVSKNKSVNFNFLKPNINTQERKWGEFRN